MFKFKIVIVIAKSVPEIGKREDTQNCEDAVRDPESQGELLT